MADHVPVVIACMLCPGSDAGQIVTLRARAWLVAVQHLIDEHREPFLYRIEGDPREPAESSAFAEASFTITEDTEDEAPKPLRRSCAQRRTSPLRSTR